MLAQLHDALGPSLANWLLVIGSGLVFVAAAAIVPGLYRRCRGKDAPPFL